MYTIRVSVEYRVSDQVELNTRSCEVTGSTGDTSKYIQQCSVLLTLYTTFDLQGLMHLLLFSVLYKYCMDCSYQDLREDYWL